MIIIRLGTSRRRPPIYKVLLHNDNHNSREYVVRVLVKVVDCLSLDEAVSVMQVYFIFSVVLLLTLSIACSWNWNCIGDGLRSRRGWTLLSRA